MLKLALLCIAAFAATLGAQCNPGTLLGPTTGGNQGNEGGGVYFDLTVSTTITITHLNFRSGNSTAFPANSVNQGFMEVWMGPGTWVGNNQNMSLWTLVDQTVTGPITHNATAGAGVLSTGQLTNGITLSPGNYGIALRSAVGVWNHNYSNPGVSWPSTPELTLTPGGATNAFLTAPTFATRIWNGEVVYTCGGNPIAVATTEPYGEGCYQYNTSYGEVIANPATSFDLAGHTHRLTFAGSIYAVSGTASSTYMTPSATAVPLPLTTNNGIASVATALGGSLPFSIVYPRGGGIGLADDLEVCSSGFLTPVDVAGNGTTAAVPGSQAGDFTPTVNELFGTGFERWAPLWQNMTPSGTQVTADVYTDPVTTVQWLLVTWNVVPVSPVGTLASPGNNSFQFAIDANGNVEYRYDSATTGFGGGTWPAIIGLTQGRGALVNEIDVSVDVLAGFLTEAIDNTALALSLSARPLLGTNPNYVVGGYDAPTTLLGVVAIDFIQHNPGLPLSGLGMGGCFQYTNPTAIKTFLTGGATQVTVPFIQGGIPNNPVYNGVNFYTQAVTLTGSCAGNPCNVLGVITSQGMRVFLGTL